MHPDCKLTFCYTCIRTLFQAQASKDNTANTITYSNHVLFFQFFINSSKATEDIMQLSSLPRVLDKMPYPYQLYIKSPLINEESLILQNSHPHLVLFYIILLSGFIKICICSLPHKFKLQLKHIVNLRFKFFIKSKLDDLIICAVDLRGRLPGVLHLCVHMTCSFLCV